MALNVTMALTGTGTLTTASGASRGTNRVVIGAAGFDPVRLVLTDGTGADQADQLVVVERTVAATTADNLDLYGGLANLLGQTANFTKLKGLVFRVVDPDGTKTLRVGPQAVANAAQLWFGGTGATAYEDVVDWVARGNPFAAGWAITSGTADILGVYNPGAGPVTYQAWFTGVKA